MRPREPCLLDVASGLLTLRNRPESGTKGDGVRLWLQRVTSREAIEAAYSLIHASLIEGDYIAQIFNIDASRKGGGTH